MSRGGERRVSEVTCNYVPVVTLWIKNTNCFPKRVEHVRRGSPASASARLFSALEAAFAKLVS